MPNGGSDCCGTCWFNQKNNGVVGYGNTTKKDKVLCTIRDVEIVDPFWTYCANHPHHNKGKIELPLGPIYVADDYPYSRKMWMAPPDTEVIRIKLLELLDAVSADPESLFPSGINIEEEVIKQLTALKEQRAIEGLLKIVRLDIEAYKGINDRNFRRKAIIIGQAIEALLELTDSLYIDELKNFVTCGIETTVVEDYDEANDNFSVIRYHLVRGLKYCTSPIAVELLHIAKNDFHREVTAFAYEILDIKLGINE